MPTPAWSDSGPLPEEPLAHGDVTEVVVRVGDTVRRTPSPESAYVHAVLAHLERVGFDGAPRFLGEDAQGREVLTFVPGEVAGQPRPAWVAEESRLVSVARLLRRYDDAAAGFVLPPGVHPPDVPDDDGLPPEPAGAPTHPGHLDVTMDNVVFAGGEAVALIDFDLARPATRVDGICNALIWWGQLGDPVDLDPLMRDLDVPRRCRLFVDAYGLPDADRALVTEVARIRSRRSWHLMKQRAETQGGGWERMWREGIGDSILRRQRWLDAHAAEIDAALLP